MITSATGDLSVRRRSFRPSSFPSRSSVCIHPLLRQSISHNVNPLSPTNQNPRQRPRHLQNTLPPPSSPQTRNTKTIPRHRLLPIPVPQNHYSHMGWPAEHPDWLTEWSHSWYILLVKRRRLIVGYTVRHQPRFGTYVNWPYPMD